MPIGDYDKAKSLVVQSVSGTPTVNKAQPIYLRSGDDSQTGTGEIVLDWSGISGASDIAVYDENDNLLDYEIEELDTTNGTGLIWVYNSWVRDGTVQAEVAYGNGAGDNQNVSGTWNNSGQNISASYRLNGNVQDSSFNANNATTVSGTSDGNGQYSGSVQFDGLDDYASVPDDSSLDLQNLTVMAWIKIEGSDDDFPRFVIKGDDSTGYNNNYDFYLRNETPEFNLEGQNNITASTAINDGEYHLVTGTYDSSEQIVYVDTIQENSQALTRDLAHNTKNLTIGGIENGNNYINANIDEVKLYSEAKSQEWIQAEYDASAKAGQVFFSQEAASGGGGGSVPPGVVETNNGERQTGSDGVVQAG